MAFKNTNLKNQARLARRFYRRVFQQLRYKRFSLDDMPILFGNSFPKSGTHLLTQVLAGFTKVAPVVESGLPAIVTFDGATGAPRPVQRILGELNRLAPGDIAYGHLHALEPVVNWFCKNRVAQVFIYRDPRDVAVSHVHYVTDMAPDHVHHQYYTEVLKDFNERLLVSIKGRPEFENPFPNIRERFVPYLDWLNVDDVLCLKFEDLVVEQDLTLGVVVDFVMKHGLTMEMETHEVVRILRENIDPKRSPTFRSGKVGGWQEVFTQEHKKVFKEIAGDLLIELGYENGYDW